MKKFEYKELFLGKISIHGIGYDRVSMLNKVGLDGWELVEFIHTSEGSIAVLKREMNG